MLPDPYLCGKQKVKHRPVQLPAAGLSLPLSARPSIPLGPGKHFAAGFVPPGRDGVLAAARRFTDLVRFGCGFCFTHR